MEAKNFRIGNLILVNDCIQEIIELPLPKNCKNENIKGIPLTDDWVNNFGFDDSEYKNGYTGIEFRSNMILDFVITKPKFMGKWQDYYAFDLGQHRFVPLRFVHELQNLFFAVTSGKELELKKELSACY